MPILEGYGAVVELLPPLPVFVRSLHAFSRGRRLSRILFHECRHLQVPQYKSLSLDKLALFINGYPEVHWYYPDNQKMRKLPKQWITNVAYAILGDTFFGWVKEQIEERNSKVALKGNLHVELDPEVHAAFMASTAVSRKCLPSISTVQKSILPMDLNSSRLPVN